MAAALEEHGSDELRRFVAAHREMVLAEIDCFERLQNLVGRPEAQRSGPMAEPGTLVRAIRLLGETLGALERRSRRRGRPRALAELGANATPAQASDFADAARPVAAAASALAGDVADLVAALDADDTAGVAAGSLSAIERIATIVLAIDDLQPAVAGIGLPAAVAGDLGQPALQPRLGGGAGPGGSHRGAGPSRRAAQRGGQFRLRRSDLPPHVLSSFDFGRLGDSINNPVDALAADMPGRGRVRRRGAAPPGGGDPAALWPGRVHRSRSAHASDRRGVLRAAPA